MSFDCKYIAIISIIIMLIRCYLSTYFIYVQCVEHNPKYISMTAIFVIIDS
jgi:hypothetical protein